MADSYSNVNNAERVKQLTAILTKMHNLLKTIFQRYGKPYVQSVSKEKPEVKNLSISERTLIDHELKVVYIVRDTGERYFTRQEAEKSIRSRK